MKVIIVEDEQHNCRLLVGMIEKFRPDWEIVETLESVKSTVSWLKGNPHPDLIFMDIQLTDGVCFSIFEKIDVKSLVIFTTAYDEYAIQAFKVNGIDYLLKPLKEDLLKKAIEKSEEICKIIEKSNQMPDYTELLSVLKKREANYRKRFLVSGVTSFSKLDVKDIAYFYTENRVTFAVTFDAKDHILDFTIEKLEEQLNPEQFFRANRSIILNSEAVLKFENYFGGKLMVQLVPPFEETVTVSRLKSTEFKNWLDS